MPVALIVGASRGLGRALAIELAGRDWSVIATVRQASALADVPGLAVEILDIADWAAMDALRHRLDGRTIDLLFVNAGIIGPQALTVGALPADALAELMLVNALSPLRLIDGFAGLVPAGGTIAAMSSGLGSIAGNESAGYEGYRMSKAALNMGLRSIAARRAGEGRTYLAVDPGWVRTDLGGDAAPLSIEQSIVPLATMLEQRAGAGGIRFVDYRNRELPW